MVTKEEILYLDNVMPVVSETLKQCKIDLTTFSPITITSAYDGSVAN